MSFLINVDDNDSLPYVAVGIAVAIIGILFSLLACMIAVVENECVARDLNPQR